MNVTICLLSAEAEVLGEADVELRSRNGRSYMKRDTVVRVAIGGIVDQVVAYIPDFDRSVNIPILSPVGEVHRGDTVTLTSKDAALLVLR